MAIDKRFDELVQFSSNFIKKQKGTWGHEQWQDYLANVEKVGLQVSGDINAGLGSVLETMKALYVDLPLQHYEHLVNHSVNFVKKRSGAWGHTEWLRYLADVQKFGIRLTDEMTAQLGSVLESMRTVALAVPSAPRKASTSPRKVSTKKKTVRRSERK